MMEETHLRREISILETLGFQNHVKYRFDIHQYLSPNDNNFHCCKTIWKNQYYDFKDEVSHSIHLMKLLDLDTVKNSVMYFNRNILKVKKLDLDEIIGL